MKRMPGMRAPKLLALSTMVLLASLAVAAASPPSELVAAARKEGRLIVVALPRDWCDYGRIIDGFEQKYGLAVDERAPEASSEQVLDAIRAGRDEDDASAPDVIDVGLSFAVAAKKEGLLQPYRISTWGSVPGDARDADGYWYGGYYGVLAFAVNTDRVPRLPTDWADLASAEFRGSVGIAGDIGSNQTIQTVLAAGLSATNGRMDEAAQRGLAFFAELHRIGNFVPIIGNAATLVDGRTPILIRWDYLALGDRDALRDKARIEVVRPRTGRLAGTYAQAISAFARHPSTARLWMEHLYSDDAQLIMLGGGCQPIRLSALINEGKVPASLQRDLPALDDEQGGGRTGPVFPTIEELERARDIIMKGWEGIVGVTIECQPAEEPDPGPISQQGTGTQLAARPLQCPGGPSVQ